MINASFFIVDAKYMGGNIQNLDGDRIHYTVRLDEIFGSQIYFVLGADDYLVYYPKWPRTLNALRSLKGYI